MSGESLYRDVVTYAGFGEHRTASDADLRTSQWIADQLTAAGLETGFQQWWPEQFFPRETYLEVGAERVECFPLWPPMPTGPKPICAPLVAFRPGMAAHRVAGRIAVVRLPDDTEELFGPRTEEIPAEAVNAGAMAVVGIQGHPSGEVVAINARYGRERWPVPVVIAAARDKEATASAAERQTEAALLVNGEYQPRAEAKNVIGRLERGDRVIVVSTPQSGWFRCGGERGPGVALFLGLARWGATRRSDTSYLFVSTSGHELGGIGMRRFMKELAPRPESVICWLHLGSSIATKPSLDYNRIKRLVCPSTLVPLLNDAFADVPGLSATTGNAAGDLKLVLAEGYRAFGLFGLHRFFHTPADGSESTAPELLEPVALALGRVLESIKRIGKQQGV